MYVLMPYYCFPPRPKQHLCRLSVPWRRILAHDHPVPLCTAKTKFLLAFITSTRLTKLSKQYARKDGARESRLFWGKNQNDNHGMTRLRDGYVYVTVKQAHTVLYCSVPPAHRLFIVERR